MTVGERVGEALEIADMSVKGLQRALEEKDVEGGSYANLHRLKGGKKERPSAELLHAVAEATGVDFVWLVTGEGEPTEARKAAREEVEGVSRAQIEASSALRKHSTLALQAAIERALGRSTVEPPDPPEGTMEELGSEEGAEWREAVDRAFRSRRIHPWTGPLADVLRRFQPSSTEPVRFPLGSGVGVEAVAEALAGPLDALDVDVERMGFDEVDDYVLSMVPVLMSLADSPARRGPRERLRSLRRERRVAEEEGDYPPDEIERLEEEIERLEARAEETDDANADEEENDG